MCVCACESLSCVQFFVTPWTVARQAPEISMGFSRQEYWSGLPFPSPGNLPDPGLNPGLLHCRQIVYCLSHQVSLLILTDRSVHTWAILRGNVTTLPVGYLLKKLSSSGYTDLNLRALANPVICVLCAIADHQDVLMLLRGEGWFNCS